MLTGFTNPVRAALAWLRVTGVPLDEAAFENLAERRGDASPEQIADRFIIRGYDDLQRLCEMADMVIFQRSSDGVVTAVAAEDWSPNG